MKQAIANYVSGQNHYTVIQEVNVFTVECRTNGFLTKTIPFLTENEAKLFASSHGHTTSQLLNEAH
jgi:hypothetical protein